MLFPVQKLANTTNEVFGIYEKNIYQYNNPESFPKLLENILHNIYHKKMAWIYLTLAGLFECGWAIGIKYTDGFPKLIPSLFTLFSMGFSFWLLSIAIRTIPVGTACAVWAGIGAVGVTLLGMILFAESKDIMRIICLLLIVSGIIGLGIVL